MRGRVLFLHVEQHSRLHGHLSISRLVMERSRCFKWQAEEAQEWAQRPAAPGVEWDLWKEASASRKGLGRSARGSTARLLRHCRWKPVIFRQFRVEKSHNFSKKSFHRWALFRIVKFHLCSVQILAGHSLSSSPCLLPGECRRDILLSQSNFTWKKKVAFSL